MPMRTVAFNNNPAKLFLAVIIIFIGLLLPLKSSAHKASDAFLSFANDSQIQLSLAIVDLDLALSNLDADNDRQVTQLELEALAPQIATWINSGVTLGCANQTVSLSWRLAEVTRRGDHAFAQFIAPWTCQPASAVSIDYRLLLNLDAAHRLLLSGSLYGESLNQVLTPAINPTLVLKQDAASGSNRESIGAVVWSYFLQGAHHLSVGWDHLAFLLALLLPLRDWRPAVWRMSCFTLGHSLSLAASTLGWVYSPSWIEPAIALSIALTVACHYLKLKWLPVRAIAVVFGLIHGLGFSSVLVQANIDASVLPWALVGFNLGIEAAQLIFVLGWCYLIQHLPQQQRWHPAMMQLGSVLLVAGSLVWFYQATLA